MFHYVVVAHEVYTLDTKEFVVNGSFETARDMACSKSKDPCYMEATRVDMVWRSGNRYTVCVCRNGATEWVKQ